MPIQNMTPEQIAEATRAVVTAGGKSTAKENRLPGETATEANARITAAYKELTAKPILTPEQIAGGMKVQFVRETSGGMGEYVAVAPLNYTGPRKVENFTDGIVPEGSKYTTGTAVGLDTGGRTIDEFRKLLVGKLAAGNVLTAKEQEWLNINGGTALNPAVTTVKKVVGTIKNADGSITTTYSDGSKTTSAVPTPVLMGKGFETNKEGVLLYNGKPFSGKTSDGKTYTNGQIDDTLPDVGGKSLVVGPAGTTPVTGVTGTAGSTGPTGTPLTAAQQIDRNNAIASLTATFNAMGLGSEIASAITDMVQKGYTTDTIMLIAQDPSSKDPVAVAFQNRFAGNAARIKAGLAPLAPAEYMATERAYRQVIEASGLPKGFYDSPDDYTKFIANDVSPTELKARVDTAADAIANADPFYVSSLKSMYGLTTGDMIAHALDPQMALPLLQKQQAAAKIGSAAAKQGWGISQIGAENLYTQGVSQAQAEQGFRTIAGMQTDQQKLAQIWGGDTAAQGQNLVASTFGTAGAAYADQQIKALQQKEIGSFSGGSGAAKGSLGIGVEQTGGGL